MTRTFLDCREMPSEAHCSIAIVADSPEELMEAAVQHAVSVHHEHDTPELREAMRQAFKPGNPPLESPLQAGQDPALQHAAPQMMQQGQPQSMQQGQQAPQQYANPT